MWFSPDFASSRAAFWGLVIVKITLGLVFINSFSIDLDEPFSIFHAQKDWNELNQIFATENNPPLHFWILHFWIKWFGISPLAVRSLSLIFSTLTLIMLYALSRKIISPAGAFWVGFCFVFSNFHHYHGLEARSYALYVFLFTSILWFMEKSKEQGSFLNATLIGILMAGLFYTHYISLITIPALVLYWLWLKRKERVTSLLLKLGLMLSSFFILALAQLQNLIQRLQHVSESGTWVNKPHWTELYGFINKFMNGPVVVALVLAFLLYLIFKKELQLKSVWLGLRSSKVGPLLFLTLGIYLSAFLLSIFSTNSVFHDRYLFFLSIGFFIALAAMIELWRTKISNWALLPFVVFLFGFHPWKTNNRASDELVSYAKSFEGTYIITPPHFDLTFIYHYDPQIFRKIQEGKSLNNYEIYPIYDLQEIPIDSVKKPLVLIDCGSEFLYGERKIYEELSRQFQIQTRKSFPGDNEVVVFE